MSARGITKALNGRWCGSYGLARCPAHDDRTPSLSLSDGDDGTLLVCCHAGCDGADVLRKLRDRGLLDDIQSRPRPVTRPRENSVDRSAAALSIWRESGPAEGTAVETYLQARGITVPVPPSLRYHPNLKHGPTGLPFPAMVAGVQAADGRVVAIHRTYLLPNGRGKAGVSTPKMALGPLTGAAVRLAATTDTVVLCEGIEDAASILQLTSSPCWACLGTAQFLNIELPERIRRVVLAPDNNEAGQAVIEPAGNRLADMGLTVEVARPPEGKDWNDLLLDYEERTALMEHDGGAVPQEAERAAWRDVPEGVL